MTRNVFWGPTPYSCLYPWTLWLIHLPRHRKRPARRRLRLSEFAPRAAFWGVGLREVSSLQLRLLGGSWVVISRVISRVAILITHIRGLITPLITTHEPPSNGYAPIPEIVNG